MGSLSLRAAVRARVVVLNGAVPGVIGRTAHRGESQRTHAATRTPPIHISAAPSAATA